MSQALASVGQIHLTNIYKEIFKKKKINIGQILYHLMILNREEGR